MPRNAIGKILVATFAMVLVACGSDDPSLDSAKAEVCESTSQWEATLQSVAQAETDPGTLRTEVDELASGLANATQALTDAGATAIAARLLRTLGTPSRKLGHPRTWRHRKQQIRRQRL